MGITTTQVDASTDRPFAGNPAAVCLLAHPQPDTWIQSVAREMNLVLRKNLIGIMPPLFQVDIHERLKNLQITLPGVPPAVVDGYVAACGDICIVK
jgi:hypothetical protein